MRGWLLSLLLVTSVVGASDSLLPVEQARRVSPVVGHLVAPESLRPCCAFGYDLNVRAIGVPIPVYQIGNVLTLDTLGHHHYNDSALAAVKDLVGLSDEKSGLIYTHRGGFIDIAHVRDTADNTFYLFSKIYPKLGQRWRFFYSEELGVRRIQLNAFTPPASMPQRYTLAAWLAGKIAFELAEWHEVAQWYGFQSVPGFSEEISAFSPEDLYSNLLGARLAINVILQGDAGSVDAYNKAMDKQIHQALVGLGVVTREETEQKFREVDGDWWNSKRRVPDKFLVLKRNYNLSDNRLPTPVPFEKSSPYELHMPAMMAGFTLSTLGELKIYKGHDMERLPSPDGHYAPTQFQQLANKAQEADRTQLDRMQK
ncbi:DUF4056 domain-containing protein [Scandinavium sp. V105_16]|uniref:DUF4056 domain-containing protein n=1 Tax=Scandinavium lactucae TaxID=3095028 RepID=A0AAJ2S1F3_9ENTR|nr:MULTISPECIES: DUF4056 domain-containing protein [unclassified Scandinavium]MDX6018790.1 DUF4056 domain-containing protein [Scandinavium sp. V105_16]MDX6030249.1 DUF4056 domain-containing protein [Scandinavium sp. V105_12]MDX6039085.1 DUF4056 domain-containing protein [Scandinavium sp. V105_6]MDX6050156.1 DUF4056 domain-containing protein [Scandinavium sp. V105_1]